MERIYKIIIAVLAVWVLILTVQVNNLSNRANRNDENIIIENQVNGFSTDLTDITAKVQSSLVSVKNEGSYASGVIYSQKDEDVYVVTNYHAIEAGGLIQVILDNIMTFQAEAVGFDARTDVAVLKIKCQFKVTPIKLGDSSILRAGEYVVAFGNPLGIEYRGSLSFGIISSNQRIIDERVEEQIYYLNMIQSDVTLNDGNSGGPLCNQNGEMVGLNTFSVKTKDAQGLSFSLPVNEMKLVVDEIIENGVASKVNLGLKVIEVNEMLNYQKNNLGISLDVAKGLYVTGVLNDFIGNYIGIKEGDIILSVNDIPTDSLDEYIRAEYEASEEIKVHILRKGEELTFTGAISND